MHRKPQAAGPALRFHRAISPKCESFQDHGPGRSGAQGEPIAPGSREQTETQTCVAGRFGNDLGRGLLFSYSPERPYGKEFVATGDTAVGRKAQNAAEKRCLTRDMLRRDAL